jgi:ABC-2 type transport system permease protein
MRKILFVIQKEFRQILRTRAYFSMLFIAPFVQLIIMGSALSTDVKHVPLTIVDYDHSRMSREIVEVGSSSASFDFKGMAASEREATTMLDEGNARIAFVIPPHFEREMKTLRKPGVQILVDGVDGNSASVSLGYATAMLGQVQAGWAKTLAPESPVQGAGEITVVPRMWYNANLESKLNFVPGLMGMLLIIVTTFLSANNIVREKEIGTLEQIMVTPLRGLQLIIGKIIPFMTLGLVQMTVSSLAAGLVFGIWMRGSIFLLYAMAIVFCFSTLGVGVLISTIARTQQQAMFMAWFFLTFSMLLSGFFVPIENIPAGVVRYLPYFNPLRYFIVIIREIFQKGTEFRFIWKEAAMMGAIGFVALLFATIRFQKRLK